MIQYFIEASFLALILLGSLFMHSYFYFCCCFTLCIKMYFKDLFESKDLKRYSMSVTIIYGDLATEPFPQG